MKPNLHQWLLYQSQASKWAPYSLMLHFQSYRCCRYLTKVLWHRLHHEIYAQTVNQYGNQHLNDSLIMLGVIVVLCSTQLDGGNPLLLADIIGIVYFNFQMVGISSKRICKVCHNKVRTCLCALDFPEYDALSSGLKKQKH